MDSDNLIGIIELGNVNIKCIIIASKEDETEEILSSSIIKSEGIKNCKIINLASATKSIRSCISSAENSAKVSLKKISIVLEQIEFLCTKFSKHRKIDGSKIQNEDIEFLLKEAKKHVLLNDKTQTIIHIFNHNYIVDGKTFIEEPINIYANSLSHEMTFITMPINNLKNIHQVFDDCDIEIERVISCTFALGAKLLNDNQLKTGSILIDLGFEKTSLGFFKNLAMVNSLTLPIGINHITKDISKVCSLNLPESEIIKDNIDFSFVNNLEIFDENNYLKNFFFKNSNFTKVSKGLVIDVLKARLDEILEMLEKQIIASGINLDFEKDVFITGGGSALLNVEKYFSNFLKLNVRKIRESNGNDNKIFLNEYFDSCLGAFKIIHQGWETEAIPEKIKENHEEKGFFGRIFGKF